ncbi:hypothetical protein Poly51_34320 [Rubripirellula tenax]|uniref:Uncharacterized protein n=1 Tax=Rubripirellula tenax TaxID=2528015 RepID=A0A5C6EYI7_9BACT|nr:hypothetical protein [Rubripirellula tenax]TWU54713.1 hypothetical protein Poly51_34320 [Rubripirellula tenax]
MQSLTNKNFGLVIAFLVPGFIAICGVSFRSTTVNVWIAGTEGVSVGGFLYSTLAALFVGLLCSTARWLCLDWLHHHTGIARPEWDYVKLQANLGAYTLLEENHYRYYQFYGNSLFAWWIAYGCWRSTLAGQEPQPADLAFAGISLLLYLGSRDTLQKYYRRVEDLLSPTSTIGIITSPLDFSKHVAERNAKSLS